jgi:hypothetical protein
MSRGHELQAFARGLFSDYQPSRADLFLLATGFGDTEPVAVIGVPTRKGS